MKILALTGIHNCGKTTTLNLLYDHLTKKIVNPPIKQPLGNPRQNDFSVIVQWKGKRIAFFTMGDYSTYLANAIYDYGNKNIDVLICACSTNKPMVKANKALNHFAATRINKSIASNSKTEGTLNLKDAKTIFNMI